MYLSQSIYHPQISRNYPALLNIPPSEPPLLLVQHILSAVPPLQLTCAALQLIPVTQYSITYPRILTLIWFNWDLERVYFLPFMHERDEK